MTTNMGTQMAYRVMHFPSASSIKFNIAGVVNSDNSTSYCVPVAVYGIK